MATSLQPENQDDQTLQDQNTENQETSDTTPPITPQEPTISPELDIVRNTFQGALQDANRRADRLERELQAFREQQNRPAQPQHNPEQDVELLTTNPRELIRQELQSVLSPILETQQQFSRAGQIEQIKNRMKKDPTIKYMHIPAIEDGFDQMITQSPNLNYEVAVMIYKSVVGYYVENGGQLTSNQPTPTNTNPSPNFHNQSVPTPPNPRPAPPINNQNQQRPKPRRVYSENERLLMKMYNMTEAEYDEWMTTAPQDVANKEDTPNG